MVAGWQQARKDPALAADALLALRGIDNPTRRQHIGALIEAEFQLKVIDFLSSGK